MGFKGSAGAPLLPLLGQHYKEVPLLNALTSVTYTQSKGFWAHTYWTVSDRFRNSHIFTFHKCFSMRYSERIDAQEFVFTQEINRKLSCFPKTLRNHGICQSVRFVAGDCQLGGPHGTITHPLSFCKHQSFRNDMSKEFAFHIVFCLRPLPGHELSSGACQTPLQTSLCL